VAVKFVCSYSDGKVGVVQELVNYLSAKGASFWYLEHPLCPATNKTSRLDHYEDGRLISSQSVGTPSRSLTLLYLKSVWLTFAEVLHRRRTIDLFIAASNIDCVAAHFALSRKQAKIVFVSIDYSPRRFANPLLNSVFKIADRMAYHWATAIWHSYPNATRLKPYAAKANSFETLHGNNYLRIRRRPFEKRDRSSLLYLGSVTPAAHLEEALIAVQTLRPRFPEISLHVIGEAADSSYMQSLKKMAASIGVADSVIWHGLITDSTIFEDIMTERGIALCLYEMTPERYSWYQLPGKVFAYAACGLPTIVLDKCGPVGTGETEKSRIGIVTSLAGLAGCISGVLENPDLHNLLSNSAANWAKDYDWHVKFDKYLGMIP